MVHDAPYGVHNSVFVFIGFILCHSVSVNVCCRVSLSGLQAFVDTDAAPKD